MTDGEFSEFTEFWGPFWTIWLFSAVGLALSVVTSTEDLLAPSSRALLGTTVRERLRRWSILDRIALAPTLLLEVFEALLGHGVATRKGMIVRPILFLVTFAVALDASFWWNASGELGLGFTLLLGMLTDAIGLQILLVVLALGHLSIAKTHLLLRRYANGPDSHHRSMRRGIQLLLLDILGAFSLHAVLGDALQCFAVFLSEGRCFLPVPAVAVWAKAFLMFRPTIEVDGSHASAISSHIVAIIVTAFLVVRAWGLALLAPSIFVALAVAASSIPRRVAECLESALDVFDAHANFSERPLALMLILGYCGGTVVLLSITAVSAGMVVLRILQT